MTVVVMEIVKCWSSGCSTAGTEAEAATVACKAVSRDRRAAWILLRSHGHGRSLHQQVEVESARVRRFARGTSNVHIGLMKDVGSHVEDLVLFSSRPWTGDLVDSVKRVLWPAILRRLLLSTVPPYCLHYPCEQISIDP